jgi:predicted membrane-bound mannosyltransferase
VSGPGRREGSSSSAGAGRSRGALVVALAVGVLARLLLLLHPGLWYDEATTGLLGLSVLQGELPVYFFGQSFMGALDGYLAAPVYWVLGVSARTLELVPVLLALAGLVLTVRLAHDAFGPRAALLTAVLLAVPPDFLLFWSHEARGHYPLAMVFGTLALLLAVRAPTAPAGRATFLFALLGGTLGLAFWTNFLVLVYVPAVAVLLLRRGLRPLVPRLLAALPAFALGSLPHWLYGVPHGTALPPPGRPVGLWGALTHLGSRASPRADPSCDSWRQCRHWR